MERVTKEHKRCQVPLNFYKIAKDNNFYRTLGSDPMKKEKYRNGNNYNENCLCEEEEMVNNIQISTIEVFYVDE